MQRKEEESSRRACYVKVPGATFPSHLQGFLSSLVVVNCICSLHIYNLVCSIYIKGAKSQLRLMTDEFDHHTTKPEIIVLDLINFQIL